MLFIIFAALVALLDQIFKYWVSTVSVKLIEDGGLVLIPKIIHLTYLENTGAAFSMLENMRWLLVGVSSVCVVLLIVVLLYSNSGFLSKISLSAVIGGAAGNLIDRILTGKVVDMFEFDFVHFAVFNIADIFITVGGVVFCLTFIFGGKDKTPQPAVEVSARPAPAKSVVSDKRQEAHAPANANLQAERVIPDFTVDLPDVEITAASILDEFDLERRLAEFDDKT